MRIVTAGTSHGAFTNWVTVWFVYLQFFGQVTGKADIGLCQGIQNGVCVAVHLMAGSTTHLLGRMGTADPVYVITLMTAQALRTLLLGRVFRIIPKADIGDFLWKLCMFFAGPVASFAGSLGTRAAQVILHKMVVPQNCSDFAVIVALQTGFCTAA